MSRSPFTISPEELAELLGDPSLSVVDGSWYLPAQNRDARAEFAAARIPGAIFFDIDENSDRRSPLPHMLPSPQEFSEIAGGMGISQTDRIVVYDGPGLFSAARVWWMFTVMGADDVRVLDGGFDRWRKAGFPVETGKFVSPPAAQFEPHFDLSRVRSLNEMKALVDSNESTILDARPFPRFAGHAPEPREGLASGHMPGARSLPFDRLVDEGRLRDIEELRMIFEDLEVDMDGEVVTTCGSGVTAAVLSLALQSVGHTRHTLYDGSWAEWGQTPGVAVETSDESGKDH